MPRPGGEADKLGNRYEGIWTVNTLLDLFTDEVASVTVEPFGNDALGVEIVRLLAVGTREFHSLKRQKAGAEWSLADLCRPSVTGRSILRDLWDKQSNDASARVTFVSATGANELRELVERASRSDSLQTFEQHLQTSADLSGLFGEYLVPLTGSRQAAFDLLKRLDLHLVSEGQLMRQTDQRIALMFDRRDGTPPVAKAIRLMLADWVLDHLGQNLDVGAIRNYLEDCGYHHTGNPVQRESASSQQRFALLGVPQVPDIFLGRDEDAAELKKRLNIQQGDKIASPIQIISAVRGWPGVGKTSLASWIAHDRDIWSSFPDGVLWTSLGEGPNLLTELASWGRYLGTDSILRAATVKEATTELAALLQNKRMLLIVDDVWSVDHVVPFRQAVPKRGALLVTTRLPSVAEHLVTRPETVYNLAVLDERYALDLLGHLAPQVVAEHPEECGELVRSLECLPLALHVAGRLLAIEQRNGWGVIELLADLRAGAERILEAQAPVDSAVPGAKEIPTVTVLLQRSTDRLPAETRERFAYMAAFAPKPATFDLEAMQAVWTVEDARPTVRELVARGLLEPVGASRFQIHALLVAHARRLCDN